jgi:tRNA threonylcarbamoyladenosine biosynthesis protein TsaE
MELLKETYQLPDLSVIIARVLPILQTEAVKHGATVITLEGDLGAGKTTFVKELAVQLGVVETVTSPTFVVMRRYDTPDSTFGSLVHCDAYRFTDETEAVPLRLEDIMSETGTLFCIEWPTRLPKLLEKYQTITVVLTVGATEEERQLIISKSKTP